MTTGRPFQGSLFSEDFLGGSIAQLADWRALDDAALDGVESALRGLFDGFPVDGSPNERLLDVRNGDVNLYCLFVECAMAPVNPEKKLLTSLVTIGWNGKNQSRNERIRYK